MEIRIISLNENHLLKRKEVQFRIEQGPQSKTPARLEVRRALATELKVGEELVFVQEMRTLTGTSSTKGTANVYENAEHAKSVEPEYIVRRNTPINKTKEEAA